MNMQGNFHFAREHVSLLTGFALLVVIALFPLGAQAQAGASGHTLYGDVKVEDRSGETKKPMSFDIILYSLSGLVVGRQKVF